MRFLTKKTAIILGLLGTVSAGITAVCTWLNVVLEDLGKAFRNCRLEDEQYCEGWDPLFGGGEKSYYSCEPCDYPYGSYRDAILWGTIGGVISLSCCITSIVILIKVLQISRLREDDEGESLELTDDTVSETEESITSDSSLEVVTVSSDPSAKELSSVGFFKKKASSSEDLDVDRLTENACGVSPK
ncbi:MAG: hypothetical protein AMJ43_01925 [Coxiella sp. DG_40]|nr:MAG: hypothetical protein AMJ43_01925 [Coxiella sp. DG_40]